MHVESLTRTIQLVLESCVIVNGSCGSVFEIHECANENVSGSLPAASWDACPFDS